MKENLLSSLPGTIGDCKEVRGREGLGREETERRGAFCLFV